MSRRVSKAVELLLEAYGQGAFPMAGSRHGRVDFYTADPRAIVPLEPGAVKFSRSLRAKVRRGPFIITSDAAFGQVARACADVPRRNPDGSKSGTWINDWIIEAFGQLHAAGYAHSVEAWVADGERTEEQRDEGIKGEEEHVLVGGLYGVAIGGAFFGESMFSRPDLGGTDASKVCFVHLLEHLRRRGYVLLDTQFSNPHMEQFGITEIPLHDYMERLRPALRMKVGWGGFCNGRSMSD
ncbi:MAG: leucyl/phenylalanyl-tRNA--protein transferase [Phycisphaerales bacterium]